GGGGSRSRGVAPPRLATKRRDLVAPRGGVLEWAAPKSAAGPGVPDPTPGEGAESGEADGDRAANAPSGKLWRGMGGFRWGREAGGDVLGGAPGRGPRQGLGFSVTRAGVRHSEQ